MIYSLRNATNGSTLAALRAGIMLAVVLQHHREPIVLVERQPAKHDRIDDGANAVRYEGIRACRLRRGGDEQGWPAFARATTGQVQVPTVSQRRACA